MSTSGMRRDACIRWLAANALWLRARARTRRREKKEVSRGYNGGKFSDTLSGAGGVAYSEQGTGEGLWVTAARRVA